MDNARIATVDIGNASRSAVHREPIAVQSPRRRNGIRRNHVMNAFRAMARGVSGPAAWARTLSFYRAASHTWARQLG